MIKNIERTQGGVDSLIDSLRRQQRFLTDRTDQGNEASALTPIDPRLVTAASLPQ